MPICGVFISSPLNCNSPQERVQTKVDSLAKMLLEMRGCVNSELKKAVYM